jgi:hypothetical protein
MPTQIKFRGGTYTEHQSFTGAEREITVDTTNNTVVVHDGVTLGGFPLALADLSNATGGVPSEATATSGETTPESCSTEGALFFNTTDNKMYVCQSSAYVEVEAEGTGGVGITSGSATPESCTTTGELFYNTTEEKLYACNGSTYETAVPDVAAIVTYGSSTPLSCSTTGALFYNTAEEVLYTCDGSNYVSATNVTTATGTSTPGSCSVEGGFFFNTAEQKLYICDSGSYVLAVPTSAQIEEGSITATAFASSISPVEIFATNPTTDNYEGRMVYNTADDKLYRYDGTAFVATIPTSDLTGTISAAQIAANAVTADKIEANAVTAGKIAAGAISATEIASNAITSDKILAGSVISDKIATNAITSGKISAGAVDAAKIATNAVTADKIAAGEVTAAKIQAGAIDSTKISANAVTADKITSGAITSSKIASDAITADKIAAGAITVDSIQAGTKALADGSFGLGAGTSIQGVDVQVFGESSVNDQFGVGALNSATSGSEAHGLGALAASTNSFAMAGWNATNAGGTTRYYCFGAGTGLGLACGHEAYTSGQNQTRLEGGNNDYGSVAWYRSNGDTYPKSLGHLGYYTAAGIFRWRNPSTGADLKTVDLCNATYAIEAVGGSTGTFTAAHDGLLLKTEAQPEVGDILVDNGVYYNRDITETICTNSVSTSANQKGVIGIFAQYAGDDHIPYAISVMVDDESRADPDLENQELPQVRAVDPQFTDIDDYNFLVMNSIGEGMINVCGENGDIAVGDLIVTSNTAGKGMKQADDIVRGYTVAKAREAVTFSDPSEVKQIACIYMCG